MKDIDKKVEDWKSRPLFKAMNDQQKRTSIGWLTDTLTTIKEAGIKEGERREAYRWFDMWYADTISKTSTTDFSFGRWACERLQDIGAEMPRQDILKNFTPTNTKEEGDN